MFLHTKKTKNLINKDLLNFPNLNTLYLHANHITSLTELDKLSALPLRTLTVHGNPIEEVKGYRQYAISRLPKLKHLDFCAITKQDRPKKKLGSVVQKKKDSE